MSNIINDSNLKSIKPTNGKSNWVSFDQNKEKKLEIENLNNNLNTELNNKLDNSDETVLFKSNFALEQLKKETNEKIVVTIQSSKNEFINSNNLPKSKLSNNAKKNNQDEISLYSNQSSSNSQLYSPNFNKPSTSSHFLLNVQQDKEKLQNIALNEATLPNVNNMKNVDSLENGDILVSLFPINVHCAWITPAVFKPELVPEELMNCQLKLTVEDYVNTMQMLINDYRFNLYIILYKRITLIWLTIGFIILFSLLLLNARGFYLFAGIVVWLLINLFGIFLTFWFKLKLMRNLERCLAIVNEQFYKNNILLAVDDKGKISCHKINLVFIYFDTTGCIKHLNNTLSRENEIDSINNTISNLSELNKSQSITLNILQNDVENPDIIITGSTPTRLPQNKKCGEKLLLRYSQRWAKDFIQNKLKLNTSLHFDSSNTPQVNHAPRHLAKSKCPCQYIEEHLSFKPFHHCDFKDIFC